jgi:agmatine/peptidylarginine deiminase
MIRKEALVFAAIMFFCFITGSKADINGNDTILLKQQKVQSTALPNNMTADEAQKMPDYLKSINKSVQFLQVPPPFTNLRTMAEWEEIKSILITWQSFSDVLTEIVRNSVRECDVVIVCKDSNLVKDSLLAKNVDISRVKYCIANTNSVWIRDYGPESVYANNVDSLFFVDWIYNRPRPDDDTVPSVLSRMLNIPDYSTVNPPNQLVGTGGNFMTEGNGMAFSSKLIETDNPTLTPLEIDSIMKRYMGIVRYVKLPVLPYDQIHHIDMHIKLLDEETLLVGQYPTGVADGPQIEANLKYILDSVKTISNEQFRIVRIPMPPDPTFYDSYPDQTGSRYLTYTNSVFVNKTLLVPTYFEYYDTTAIRILKENLPGYNVVGIDCNEIIKSLGAIHCVSKGIGVEDPLRVVSERIDDLPITSEPIPVVARIMHKSGIKTAKLFYRIGTDTTTTSVNLFFDNTSNRWYGQIPCPTTNSKISYYIMAQSNSGKVRTYPATAPDGWISFNVYKPSSVTDIPTMSSVSMKPVFPNPASAMTCITVDNPSTTNANLSLYYYTGNKISTIYSGSLESGEKDFFFDASKYATGVYIIKLTTNNSVQAQKVVVRN